MFGYLDSNQDNQLSMSELYDLEHNERESCLKPFLDKCDDNRLVYTTISRESLLIFPIFRAGISFCLAPNGVDASARPTVLALLCGDVPSPVYWAHTFQPAIPMVSFYLHSAILLSVPAGVWISTVSNRTDHVLEANLTAVIHSSILQCCKWMKTNCILTIYDFGHQ